MQITLDTENLTDTDKQVLALLGGVVADQNVAALVEQATEPEKPAPKAAAEKAAAAPKAEAPAAAEPTPESSAASESLEVAVELATEMVSSGQANRIKLALADQGSTRVGLLDPDKIGAFIEEATRFKDMSDVDFAAEESSRG